jgi:hypothetical protein
MLPRRQHFLFVLLLLLPAARAEAGNAATANSGERDCVTDTHGRCVAKISPDSSIHPCKTGNCGLEYKQRGGGGGVRSRSVLKMTIRKSGSRAGYGRRSGRGGKSFRRGRVGRGGHRKSGRRHSSFRMRL